jgi:2-haloacid dehalogenase
MGRRPDRIEGILVDLLMAVMNSLQVWTVAARHRRRGLAWRDAVTERMVALSFYAPYEKLVADAAKEAGLDTRAPARLIEEWARMEPWPDAHALSRVSLPYGFVTNSSTILAQTAADRSGLEPRFTMSAEEAGRFKPAAEVYRLACRRLGTEPQRTLFIAGSPYDAEGARVAGLRSCLVLRRRDHPPRNEQIWVATSVDEIVATLLPYGPVTQ